MSMVILTPLKPDNGDSNDDIFVGQAIFTQHGYKSDLFIHLFSPHLANLKKLVTKHNEFTLGHGNSSSTKQS